MNTEVYRMAPLISYRCGPPIGRPRGPGPTKLPDPVRVEARHRHHIAAGKGCGDHVEQQGNGVHIALEFRHANMPQQVSNNRNSQL